MTPRADGTLSVQSLITEGPQTPVTEVRVEGNEEPLTPTTFRARSSHQKAAQPAVPA